MPANSSKRKCRWLQIGIRSVMLLLLVVGVFLGHQDRQRQIERRAADEIERRCPRAEIIWESWVSGLSQFGGRPGVFSRVKHIELAGEPNDDSTFATLPWSQFSSLESVGLDVDAWCELGNLPDGCDVELRLPADGEAFASAEAGLISRRRLLDVLQNENFAHVTLKLKKR